MAAGNSLIALLPQDGTPPAATYATFDTMTGASTPAEAIPVLDFDDTTIEYMDFYCQMPRHYGGGGLTIKFTWSGAANTNAVVWSAALRRVPDDAEDLDTTAFTYDYNNASAATAPSAIGETSEDTVAFTDGADMDSTAAGEYFILRVRRVPTDAGDTMVGDASIHSIEVRETP